MTGEPVRAMSQKSYVIPSATGAIRPIALEASDHRWNTLVRSHAEATAFHQPEWAELLSDVYGYSSLVFALVDDEERIVAGLPIMGIRSRLTGNRWVAMPFTDFCPPLLLDGQSEHRFASELIAWAGAKRLLPLRVHWQFDCREGAYPGEEFAHHTTALDVDPEALFKRFKKTRVQQAIRQAEQSGITTRLGKNVGDLRQFYRLHLITRQRLGTPVQPWRFFSRLWDLILSKGLGFLVLSEKDGQALAGAVFLACNRTVIYKYSASDPAAWSLRPNNLVLWHAIRMACQQGYARFDWGKSEIENQGLRDFKGGWASEERRERYTVIGEAPAPSQGSKQSRALLSWVIRHSPRFVCRAVGEILYTHSA